MNIEVLAEYYGIPEDRLREFDARDETWNGHEVVTLPYHSLEKAEDETRPEIRRQIRRDAEDKKWRWADLPDDYEGPGFTPFGINVHDPTALDLILLVEGVGDVIVCHEAGVPANGIPGATTFHEKYAPLYATCEVCLWREHGTSGTDFIRTVSDQVPEAKVISHPDYDDPADMYRSEGAEALKAFIEDAMDIAPLAVEVLAEEERQAVIAEILVDPEVQRLLAEPDLFETLKQEVARDEFGGDPAPVIAAYITMSSRVMPNPLALYLYGDSSAGKTHIAKQGAKFVGEQSIINIEAATPGFWTRDTRSLTNVAAFVKEWNSLPQGDGEIASCMREFMSEGFFRYNTTEPDNSGKRKAVTYDRGGPASIVVTGTKPLQDETSTRVMSYPVPDDWKQNEATHDVIASKWNRTRQFSPPSTAWPKLQRLLDLEELPEVVIPFADAIWLVTPRSARSNNRYKRDLGWILTATAIVALLRRHQRRLDEDGYLVAEIEDYVTVREAIAPAFQMVTSGGLTPAMRETHRLINENPEITNAELASMLGLGESATSSRVSTLRKIGLVKRGARRDDQTYPLMVDNTLPEMVSLPTAEQVESYHSNSQTPDQTEFEADFDTLTTSTGRDSAAETVQAVMPL